MAEWTSADVEQLVEVVREFHWLARRYCDHRMSSAVGAFNAAVRWLLARGVRLDPTGDATIWARDRMGRAYDGLSEAEATPGTPEARGDATASHLPGPGRG